MKIRNGFVSNSSSSSFVIYKPLLDDKQLKTLVLWWSKIEDEVYDEDGPIFDDSEKNYIRIVCNSHSEELMNLLREIGLKNDDYSYVYR